MGSAQPLEASTDSWVDQEWESVSVRTASFGKTATMRNLRTGAMVDEYQIIWESPSDYYFYLRSFNWRSRHRNSSPILGSLGLKLLSKQQFCSGRWAAAVYLQHAALRLSDIEDIPLSDSLYILLTAFEGFQQLYYHAGYFRVDEDLICVERTGKVKVWVNRDLSKNFPQTDPETACLRRDETHMVRQIVDIVEANTDPQEMPQLFSSFLQQLRRRERCQIGFERAQLAVIEYAQTYRMTIGHRMESALELYQSPSNTLEPYHSSSNPAITSASIVEHFPPMYSGSQVQPLQLSAIKSLPNLNPRTPQGPSASCNCPSQFEPVKPPHRPESIPTPPQFSQEQMLIHSTSRARFSDCPESPSEPVCSRKVSDSPENGTRGNTSHPTTKTKSYIACLEQSQNQSIHFQDTHRTITAPNNWNSHRGGNSMSQEIPRNWLRFSQNIEENYAQHQFASIKFNRDTFGLPARRRVLRQSETSMRVGSSNSSCRSPERLSRRSYKASSRKQSIKNSVSLHSQVVESDEQERYFRGLQEYGEIDPEIAADIIKYLG